MASRIKGITVEIGGDTSGLEKSLSDVNNSIKKTQSQLRDVNSLLKLDPSNTASPCTEAGTAAVCHWRYREKAAGIWSKCRKMWRKPLSGETLEKTSTWLSSARWRKPGGR